MSDIEKRAKAELELRLEQKPLLEVELQNAIDSDRRMGEANLRAYLERLDIEIPLLERIVNG